MPRKKTPGNVAIRSLTIAAMIRGANGLAVTAASQALGMVGVVASYLGWSAWAHILKTDPFLSRATICSLGYVAAVAIHAIFSRSTFVAHRCLSAAKMLFVGQRITRPEYYKMRSHCLKKSGLA